MKTKRPIIAGTFFLSRKGVTQLVGAHKSALYHLSEKVSHRPSLHFPPNVYPRLIQICLSPSFLRQSASHPQTTLPCQGPTDTPTPPNLCSGPLLPEGLPTGETGRGQAARKATFFHRPQQLTLVTRNAMASSSTGSSSVERSRELEPPTSRGPEFNTDQQPFLCSTLGDAGPCLRFKPRTAPSLLACSWHSLPSHWRLRVPPRMRLQGDPAETYERGRSQSEAAPQGRRPRSLGLSSRLRSRAFEAATWRGGGRKT